MLIAHEDGQAERYREELVEFAALLDKEKSLEQAMCNPLYGAEHRRNVLQKLVSTLGLSNVMSSFLLLLFDKRRIGFIGHVNEFFQKLADEEKGIARASVISASELSSEAIEKIRNSLSQRIKKDVILEVRIDPDLIGGVVTKIGDMVLDGSIKTQLINMRESLKKGEGV